MKHLEAIKAINSDKNVGAKLDMDNGQPRYCKWTSRDTKTIVSEFLISDMQKWTRSVGGHNEMKMR